MNAVSETPASLGYRMPAEWASHAATWIAWPFHATDWPGKKSAIPWVFAEMVRALQDGERIRVLVRSPQERTRAERVLSDAACDLNQVDFVLAPTNRSWTRDSLPIFVTRSKQRGGGLGAVKFRFNGWARYRDHELDDEAGRRVAKRFATESFFPRVDRRAVVLEGGAIDGDGQGTMLATEECLLKGRYARNADLGRAGTEHVLRDYLGVRRVLWIERGIAGDDTSGHVDDFVRFVAPGVIVLCEESRRADANYAPLADAYERLRGERDARGRKLDIIRLPMPEPVVYRGDRLPASYANFLIGNSAVLVPTFDDPADRVALGILGELFPSRRIVGIHARDLVVGLGTLHCSTQQEPKAT